MNARRAAVGLAVAATGLGVPAAGLAADPPVAFTNTGTDCRNLAVSGELDPAVARELVPSRFALPDPPTGFVELATCAAGELDGAPLGAFRLAEAAVNVVQPAPVPGGDGVITQDIYALSQLDSDARLSARKRAVGFRSEVVDIGFTGSGLLSTRIDADIPWPTSPYTMGADLTPPVGPVPAVDLITRIWGLGDRGLVVTRNDIFRVREAATGTGAATFAPGSPLAQLFGTTELRGGAISGRGDFVNVTRIVEPTAPTPSAAPAGPTVTARVLGPARRGGRSRLRMRVGGAGGPLVATVRRDERTVRTLRGRSPLVWTGLDTRRRPLRPGIYAVRVRRAAEDRPLDVLRVRIGRRGPARLLAD